VPCHRGLVGHKQTAAWTLKEEGEPNPRERKQSAAVM
jgi:hypothetical protein